MNFVKFKNVIKNMTDIYIDIDEIMAIESPLLRDKCTLIYTRNGSTFMVDGNIDHVMRMIFEGCPDRYEINSRNSINESCEKRCGLCKHYEVGSRKQCRKHFEDRAEDDKPCYYYDTNTKDNV